MPESLKVRFIIDYNGKEFETGINFSAQLNSGIILRAKSVEEELGYGIKAIVRKLRKLHLVEPFE